MTTVPEIQNFHACAEGVLLVPFRLRLIKARRVITSTERIRNEFTGWGLWAHPALLKDVSVLAVEPALKELLRCVYVVLKTSEGFYSNDFSKN